MSFASFSNRGILIHPAPYGPLDSTPITSTAINSAGESVCCIGRVVMPGGPGTSKTCSSAGGKVAFHISSLTFANAGTNVRVGLQDIAATGIEDGTFDVYADFVGGGGGLTTGVNNLAMTNGSKTLTYGDVVGIAMEMTARGGAADSVVVTRINVSQALHPYMTQDTAGTGAAKIGTTLPMATIVFDDGTVGWVGADSWIWGSETQSAFSNASTPDEYAMIFQVPFACRITSLYAYLSSMASTDDFELILYSDPLGTPVAERTITVDADLMSSGTSGFCEFPLATTFDLSINTDYAVALRPTTANTIQFDRIIFGTGNAALRGATMLGTNWYQASRTNQTGAFGSSDTTKIPMFGFRAVSFDDAVVPPSGGGNSFYFG